MVADAVEAADVAADEPRGRVGLGAAFLEEHAIAQLLGAADLRLGRRQADVERADRRERLGQPQQIARLTTAERRPAARRAGRGRQAHRTIPRIRTPRIAVRSFLSHGFMTGGRDAGALDPAPRSRPSNRRVEPPDLDRLGEERVEPRRGRGVGVLGRGAGGQRDDRGARRLRLGFRRGGCAAPLPGRRRPAS